MLTAGRTHGMILCQHEKGETPVSLPFFVAVIKTAVPIPCRVTARAPPKFSNSLSTP